MRRKRKQRDVIHVNQVEDKYYPPAEYSTMSPKAKKKLKTLRDSRGHKGKGKGGGSNANTKAITKLTKTVAALSAKIDGDNDDDSTDGESEAEEKPRNRNNTALMRDSAAKTKKSLKNKRT